MWLQTSLGRPEPSLPLSLSLSLSLSPSLLYLTWSWYQKECYDSRDLCAQCHLGFHCGYPIKLRIPCVVYPGCYGSLPVMGVICRQRGHYRLQTETRRNNERLRKEMDIQIRIALQLRNWIHTSMRMSVCLSCYMSVRLSLSTCILSVIYQLTVSMYTHITLCVCVCVRACS